MGDMGSLLKQAQMMQRELERAKAELADRRVEGTAGGRAVVISMAADPQGALRLIRLAETGALPEDMKNVVAKVTATGNPNVLVTERGVSFGYNTLVTDMRALPIMAEMGCPVIFDATHSVQQPGGQGTSSGGDRRFVPVLARAAVAVGVAGLFIETHQDPDAAPSDGPNMVPLAQMAELIETHNPGLLAVERLFFSKNAQTAFAVGQARGVVLLAAAQVPFKDTAVPFADFAAYTKGAFAPSVWGYRSEQPRIRSSGLPRRP